MGEVGGGGGGGMRGRSIVNMRNVSCKLEEAVSLIMSEYKIRMHENDTVMNTLPQQSILSVNNVWQTTVY